MATVAALFLNLRPEYLGDFEAILETGLAYDSRA
jgi:hypothetical protein